MGSIGYSEVLTMMASFVTVIALLAATLFGIKKYSAAINLSGARRIELLEIKNLGSRQKLVLVSVNGEQVLIGLTAHSLTQLGSWVDPPRQSDHQPKAKENEAVLDKTKQQENSFGKLFAQAKTGRKE